MKILFAGHMAETGGAQNVAHAVLLGLKQRGFEIVTVFPDMGAEVIRAREAGFEVHIVPSRCWHYVQGRSDPPAGMGAYLEKFSQRVARWRQVITEVKPDVIYINTAVIIEPVVAAVQQGVPRLWHIQELFRRDTNIENSGFADLVMPLMELPGTRVLAVSQAGEQELAELAPKAKVDAFRYGIDVTELDAGTESSDKAECFGCGDDDPVVLFAGEYSWRKGIDLVFEAIPIVLAANPKVHFYFAGNDANGVLAEFMAKVAERFADNLKALGFCEDMLRLYRSADMLVLPSRGDPFPTVVMEAMAAGLPVVGTRSGGMEEQIVEGETGLLVAVDDAWELAGALNRMLSDPAGLRDMGRAAHKRIAKKYSRKKMLDTVEASLRNAVGDGVELEQPAASLLAVLTDFVEMREREHAYEAEQAQEKFEKLETDFRRVLDMPPVKFIRQINRVLPGRKTKKSVTKKTKYGLRYFVQKEGQEKLEMLHWKLAMRFGESAENIFKVIPFLLKPAMRLLGGGAAESAAPKKSLSPIFDALMEAPFAEREKRIVAGMRARASELQAGYAERPQSELVSVIMPTYNRAELMQRALRSLINQSYSNWEVIVVDDGGNDNTAEAVKMLGDNRIRYIRHNKRRGVSAARNSGLEQARGSCIAYLDSDNEWEPDYLLLMVNYLADHSGMRAVYCAQAMYTEEKGEDKPLLTGIRFAEFQYSILVHRNYIDLNVFMHHRSLYDRYGGFDESLRRLVDWDLFIRYMRHAVPLALPCILTRYHQVRSAKRITDREGYWKNIKKLQALHSVHRLNLQNYPAGVNPADMYSLPSAEHSAEIRRKVSIVIPSYGVLDCLKTCVEAIQKFTPPEAYELVIFDNASDADVREYLCGLDAKGLAKIQLCDQNMGFTFAVNEGIRMSEPGNDIVLMNNDAIVTEGWLEEFAAVTDAMPDAGLLAPQQVLLPFTHTMKTHVPYCLPFREVDVTISAHHDNLINPRLMPEKAYQELSFVNFFCVYITRECLDDTGLLNEEDGRHYKSDRLFCEKMLNRGRFKIVYTPYCKIYHLLQQSTIDLKKKNVKEYKTMFVKNEWSGDAERLRRTLRSGTDNAQNPSPQK